MTAATAAAALVFASPAVAMDKGGHKHKDTDITASFESTGGAGGAGGAADDADAEANCLIPIGASVGAILAGSGDVSQCQAEADSEGGNGGDGGDAETAVGNRG
ncbi:hypothetical protein [Saccharopolyspora rectivirgula]|uniref:DUF320 domain-containing protein n=1 Tax=Saccharopolyspora rectivirgula TaxID=28042 RepID=A0A073AWE5_9PSEU|nr:hypothetical protein [Saccharopolyspora rectivirgula]KEI43621.1 hypothetical protein GU90_14910 [Saccharopolyspora rectivirgula]